MIQIRSSIFETNSSSTHSITICLKSDYDLWKQGKLYLNENSYSNSPYVNKSIVTLEEARDIILQTSFGAKFYPEDIDEEFLRTSGIDYSIYTYGDYLSINSNLEWFDETFVTPSKESVIAFGYFGYC